MKNKLLKAAVAGLILTVSNFSNAALMRTTIDLTITSISGNYAAVAVNDIFNFQADYDDAGTYMRNTDAQALCLTSHIPTAGVTCGLSYNPSSYPFFSNSVINIAQMFDVTAMMAAGNNFYDRSTLARSWTYQSITTANTTTVYQVVTDAFEVFLTTNHQNASALMHYQDIGGITRSNSVTFALGTFATVALAVPEPSTLAIFALGLIGLGFRRSK